MNSLIDYGELETQRQIREVYDALYFELFLQPSDMWSNPAFVKSITDDRLETMQDMLNIYLEHEDFCKCHYVTKWIQTILYTKSLCT